MNINWNGVLTGVVTAVAVFVLARLFLKNTQTNEPIMKVGFGGYTA
jgi:hypothetical protein